MYGEEESLYIYAGASATGTPIYSEDINTLQASKVYDPTNHCLAYGTYFALMGDSYGDGWTSGSNLLISDEGVEVVVIEWTCGGSASSRVYSCSQIFVIDPPPAWQYSSTPQTSSSWTTEDLDWTIILRLLLPLVISVVLFR